MKPNALIITGNGLNTEKEIDYSLRTAGAQTKIATIYELLDNDVNLKDYHMLALCGGFSDGDDLGAGVATAKRLGKLDDELREFYRRDTLIYDVCNGFQIAVKLGAFDDENSQRDVTLTNNDAGFFYNGWVHLKVDPNSKCVFTRGLDNLYLPVRHGEGKFVGANDEAIERLRRNGQVVMRYVDDRGNVATRFPDNPNGSIDGIAGICDKTGRIFGTMPHFEAFNHMTNHPQYTRLKRHFGRAADELEPDGIKLFRNMVGYFS
ncbi:MAG: phosphoribosylformylglycinamidine synthase subunit PurQ [Candidatus Aenigmarchaeota archaeon]|nr:phosphoribosylformylglycinamidine synthase subunit PurQ [Candidatus Aenigmarchaeota archaeon]